MESRVGLFSIRLLVVEQRLLRRKKVAAIHFDRDRGKVLQDRSPTSGAGGVVLTNKAKRKGTRAENIVVKAVNRAFGRDVAKRVPLSGAAEGFKGDVHIRLDLDGQPRILSCEVKSRKGGTGFKTLERWQGSNDFLFLREDRKADGDMLVCVRAGLLLEILEIATRRDDDKGRTP